MYIIILFVLIYIHSVWNFEQFLTRTVWWAIPTIWLPVVCYVLSISARKGLTFPQIGLIVAFGVLTWTLLEYTLHRFLFHIETKSYWLVRYSWLCNINITCFFTKLILFCSFCRANTAHYLLHGCHHKHPQDGLRLVFPPTATAILLVPVSIYEFFLFQNVNLLRCCSSSFPCLLAMEASPPHSYSCYSSCYAWRHFVWLCDVWCYSLLSAPWST